MSNFVPSLLKWYADHARVLPWRDNPDPYAVWVSEIMLQQTRVETVIPYFERWMQIFPTIETLAAAEQTDVLNAWEGLGYYSRARNLHKAAGVVAELFEAALPADVHKLRTLPGIGPYTAGAIASIAFGLDEPVVDGNVRRVLSRLLHLDIPANTPAGERKLWGWAAEYLPVGRASEYNQGLMELGARVCLPRVPKCTQCPVQEFCVANALGLQETLPILKAKPVSPHYTVTAGVIEEGGRYLLARRPENGLLGGMWEVPGGKQEIGETLQDCLKRELVEELAVEVGVGDSLGVFTHAYTHFKITLHAFRCQIQKGKPIPIEAQEIRWVTLPALTDFPMGKVDRLIAGQLQTEQSL